MEDIDTAIVVDQNDGEEEEEEGEEGEDSILSGEDRLRIPGPGGCSDSDSEQASQPRDLSTSGRASKGVIAPPPTAAPPKRYLAFSVDSLIAKTPDTHQREQARLKEGPLPPPPPPRRQDIVGQRSIGVGRPIYHRSISHHHNSPGKDGAAAVARPAAGSPWDIRPSPPISPGRHRHLVVGGGGGSDPRVSPPPTRPGRSPLASSPASSSRTADDHSPSAARPSFSMDKILKPGGGGGGGSSHVEQSSPGSLSQSAAAAAAAMEARLGGPIHHPGSAAAGGLMEGPLGPVGHLPGMAPHPFLMTAAAAAEGKWPGMLHPWLSMSAGLTNPQREYSLHAAINHLFCHCHSNSP